jgi:hypothetical protein
MSHRSSAHDHTTCGNDDDRDRRERIDRSETHGSTHDPPLGHDRTEGGEGDVPLRKRPDLEGQSAKKNVRKTHPEGGSKR